MSPVSALGTGVLVGVIGFVGLYFSAHAADQTMYAVGLVVFVFSVAFEYWLIRRWFDDQDGGPDRGA